MLHFGVILYPYTKFYYSLTEVLKMECIKKALKIIAIIVAVAAVVAGAYLAIKKFLDSKKESGCEEENYVSCSCCEA